MSCRPTRFLSSQSVSQSVNQLFITSHYITYNLYLSLYISISSTVCLWLLQRTPVFVESLLSMSSSGDIQTYNEELTSYLCDSFGNPLRIDYGTGHETNFAIFGLCLFKLRLLAETDLSSFVLRSFASYIEVMRKLQGVYYLEPAGSHGKLT